jgi:hypothetical protein
VREAVASWEREGRPAAQARWYIRRLFELASRHSSPGGVGAEARLGDEDSDSLAEETVAASADYAELADRAVEIVDSIVQRPTRTGGNEDVPAFFASIKLYLEERFSEELNLPVGLRPLRHLPDLPLAPVQEIRGPLLQRLPHPHAH